MSNLVSVFIDNGTAPKTERLVGMLGEGLNNPSQSVRRIEIIRIEPTQNITGCDTHSFVDGIRRPVIRLRNDVVYGIAEGADNV